MKLLYKLIFVFSLISILSFSTTNAYSQCAMCRATVESNAGDGRDETDNQVGRGINTGILYLMVIPYVLIGTVGFLWYRSNRKKNE